MARETKLWQQELVLSPVPHISKNCGQQQGHRRKAAFDLPSPVKAVGCCKAEEGEAPGELTALLGGQRGALGQAVPSWHI